MRETRCHRSFRSTLASVLALPALLALAACEAPPQAQAREAARVIVGGDLERGRHLIEEYGCSSCHTIPGVPGANSLVGPPLAGIASRVYIAGVITNQPANMVRWLENPPGVDPLTAMPNMGLSAQQALDIATYLYTLR